MRGLFRGRLSTVRVIRVNFVVKNYSKGRNMAPSHLYSHTKRNNSTALSFDLIAERSYTIKRRVYVFVCLFSLSGKRLMNRLTQAHKIGNGCRVNFSWSSEHIFNFLRFVIQKLRVF